MDVPDYDLPPAAVAQTPVDPRDRARLLDALDPGGELVDRQVADLPELLGAGDVLVVNDSRVLPARLALRKPTGGRAEVLLLEPLADQGGREWEALVRPGRRLPPGTNLVAPTSAEPVLEVADRLDDGRRRVRFLAPPDQVMAANGSLPLPPYIHRRLEDEERYQTVYAERPGSVAAPTAGLHLTPQVLAGVQAAGARLCRLELAVGLGTFRPVTSERAEDHLMHVERYRVPPETWEACAEARRVVAVGTTCVRALETAAATGELEGRSDLFIRPGFAFEVVDVLLTNFHMPRSTLLLLLEAFMGPRWREVYASALERRYRFLSFGDAMICKRAPSGGGPR